jgi:hypothetical protein
MTNADLSVLFACKLSVAKLRFSIACGTICGTRTHILPNFFLRPRIKTFNGALSVGVTSVYLRNKFHAKQTGQKKMSKENEETLIRF